MKFKTGLVILVVIMGIIAIIVISIDASNKMGKKEKFSQRMILNSNNVRSLKR